MDSAKKEEAVIDTSSLIFIAKIDSFYLAKNIFSQIFVPKEVVDEISIKKTSEMFIIEKEFSSFLKKIEVNIKEMPLDEGEKAAISCCLERKINILISDDLKARKYAQALEIKTMGVLGIMLLNLKIKSITKNEFLSILQKLIDNNYYMSPQLYAELMREINNI